eukprot:CAMPEP_0201492738 /NCGR_PEP_ID=MMETSP0151_2-20130828/34542_1 /ASSEMBLY_ACC=CAM_ASM_000257 /TAXON_ID=200890 /ORGANISM="Paramoeba atlantica, Strain 621/1 / CCAP 1560/9" /LENGTH=420 /DNA_ID=CAMNT_0047879733 /DNA_START=60 /DNA_END=1323 /DNA_ORIENTATION=+
MVYEKSFTTEPKICIIKNKRIHRKRDENGAHNYAPLPVVLTRGEGVFMFDVDDKKYFDFLSGYSALNQGHCHPRIVKVLKEQAEKLTLTSRAFHNSNFGDYAEYLTKYFNYDMMLPMNTGVEAGEAAVKLARKWSYQKKGLPENSAKVIFAENNFWGRSIAAVSSSTDPVCRKEFGPYTPGFPIVKYNSLPALEEALEDPHVAAFYVEPIQGEAGVIVPDEDYFPQVAELCRKKNVLLICDEIQTGLGRTGKMLCSEHFGIKPDMIVLGKALSGGMFPVSAVLSNSDVMLCLKPGEHGSTYGGNPLACAVATEALKVLKEENLVENSAKMGEVFRKSMAEAQKQHSWIVGNRGKGLFNAIEISPSHHTSAKDICVRMKDKGLLAKQTHDFTIRFAPPLIITDEEMAQGLKIIRESLDEAA